LTPQDLKTYENAVTSAKQDLSNSYDGALNTLNNAYTNIFNAYSVSVLIHDNYFSSADQEGIAVSEARDDIKRNMQNVKSYLDVAAKSSSNNNIDSATSQMLSVLDNVFNDLKTIREQCEQGTYHYSVSSADKTSLDNQKTYINNASTSVTTLQNNISSYKTALQKAEDNFLSKTANARPEDIAISQSQIDQAQANVNALQSQLNDNYLTSPMDGIITEVNIKKGQVVFGGRICL
jgi:HlyD family secretion protein